MQGLLEAARFVDIEVNADGTYNATKDGTRFYGLFLSDHDSHPEFNDIVVSIPVKFSYRTWNPLWVEHQ